LQPIAVAPGSIFVTPNLRRFRFGLMAENVRSPGEMVELARRAEATGYATILTRDHFIKEPFGHQLGPIVALAMAAEATTTLRLGSLVFCNDYRHPVLLAQEAATLDLLSNGRLELGLGAGFQREEYGQAGIPFERPGLRVDRLEESLRVLKGLFSDGPLTFAGRHYKISDLNGFPKPVQRPHPPFHVAAFGPRMLGIAGREADIINLQSGSSPRALQACLLGGVTGASAPRRAAGRAAWRDLTAVRVRALSLRSASLFALGAKRHSDSI
jgi:probable F420-dependent oxidoreductase